MERRRRSEVVWGRGFFIARVLYIFGGTKITVRSKSSKSSKDS